MATKSIDDYLQLEGHKIFQIESRIQHDDYNCGVKSMVMMHARFLYRNFMTTVHVIYT